MSAGNVSWESQPRQSAATVSWPTPSKTSVRKFAPGVNPAAAQICPPERTSRAKIEECATKLAAELLKLNQS